MWVIILPNDDIFVVNFFFSFFIFYFGRVDFNKDRSVSAKELQRWIMQKTEEHFQEAVKENKLNFHAVDPDGDGELALFLNQGRAIFVLLLRLNMHYFTIFPPPFCPPTLCNQRWFIYMLFSYSNENGHANLKMSF